MSLSTPIYRLFFEQEQQTRLFQPGQMIEGIIYAPTRRLVAPISLSVLIGPNICLYQARLLKGPV